MELIFDELPVAFPWYPKLEQQQRYKENVEKACDYKLISPNNTLLPFQFRRPEALNGPISWIIRTVNTQQTVVDITASLSGDDGLRTKNLDGYDYFYFNGNGRLKTGAAYFTLPSGFYESVITFGDGSHFYSEIFYVPIKSFSITWADSQDPLQLADPNDMNYLRLIWNNDADLKPVFYNELLEENGVPYFRQCVYLDTFVTACEPEIVVDGPKDGNDTVIKTFQKAVLKYRITDMVADYLKVALFLMQMHDNVELTTQQGRRKGMITNFTISSSLEFNGSYSQIDILFEQDLALVKSGCAENFVLPGDCPDEEEVTLEMIYDPGLPAKTYDISGTGNAAGWIEIFASVTGMTPYIVVASLSVADFVGGGYTITVSPTYTKFKAVNKNFNCIFGTSSVVTPE